MINDSIKENKINAAAMSTKSLGLQYCDCENYCGSIDNDEDNDNNNTIIRS